MGWNRLFVSLSLIVYVTVCYANPEDYDAFQSSYPGAVNPLHRIPAPRPTPTFVRRINNPISTPAPVELEPSAPESIPAEEPVPEELPQEAALEDSSSISSRPHQFGERTYAGNTGFVQRPGYNARSQSLSTQRPQSWGNEEQHNENIQPMQQQNGRFWPFSWNTKTTTTPQPAPPTQSLTVADPDYSLISATSPPSNAADLLPLEPSSQLLPESEMESDAAEEIPFQNSGMEEQQQQSEQMFPAQIAEAEEMPAEIIEKEQEPAPIPEIVEEIPMISSTPAPKPVIQPSEPGPILMQPFESPYYTRPHHPSRPVPKPITVRPLTELSTIAPVPMNESDLEQELPAEELKGRTRPMQAGKSVMSKPPQYPTSKPKSKSTLHPTASRRPVAPIQAPANSAPMAASMVALYQGPGDITCRLSDAYYPIENECEGFYECKHGLSARYLCPDGLYFNPDTVWPAYPCVYPYEARCIGRSILHEPIPSNECPRQYGYFAIDGSDCSKYMMCQEGRAVYMDCPVGLAFNPDTDSCDWPVNVPSCNPEVFQGFTCPDHPDPENEDIVINYKYGNSCKEYVACQHNRPRLLRCDNGYAFDENAGFCVDQDYVPHCSD